MENLIDFYHKKHGKVTNKWELYISEYERLFSSFRNYPVCFLEIGVQNGGSLEIWAEYFTKSKIIVGCDISKECAELFFNDPRISVVIGDINTELTLTKILNISPSYNIIVDDGSHLSRDVIKSFSYYFHHLSYGGMYVIEDLHCSYWSAYEGGLYHPFSSMHFFKRLADVVNHEHWGVNKKRHNILQGFTDCFGIDFRESDLAEIHSIEFINSICVVRKEWQQKNRLGERFVAGSLESVASGHCELSGTFLSAPPQSDNPWSTRFIAPEEDWERISNELSERDAQIVEIKQAMTQRDSQIGVLQYALSEREKQIVALQRILAERDCKIGTLQDTLTEGNDKVKELEQQILMYLESNSWKATRLFRSIGQKLRKLCQSVFS